MRCRQCETARATSFLEIWDRTPSALGLSLDECTPVCEECLPFLLDVPHAPWKESDSPIGRMCVAGGEDTHDDDDKDGPNWEDDYWSFVREHAECKGNPIINETKDDDLLVTLTARCPGCGQAWSETVEAEDPAYVDLDDLRLAVTDPTAWQRRAVERMWKREETLKRTLPSKPDRSN